MRLLLAALAASLLQAGAGPVGPVPAAPVLAPFVWRVTAPDAPAGEADHLVGTLHVALGPREVLAPELRRVLRQAEGFTMEVDLGAVSPELVARWTRSDRPEALRRALGEPAWGTLVQRCEARGVSRDQLLGLKAWYVSLLLIPASPDPETLMDARLRREAGAAGVPPSFLESPDDQLRALDAVSDEEDLRQLREALEDPERLGRELAQLEAAYRAGDLEAISRYVFDPERLAAYPDFYEQVFWARNRRWLPRLEQQARARRVVVAVGLGHMLGPRGLLAALAARGWRVARGV
ncbi:MAG: TraB/GumN family protein [Candidatus Sericytochromatia bacterium]|nr:TraB/GumN family protein [Candidatus Sericytochromatia bacterium]